MYVCMFSILLFRMKLTWEFINDINIYLIGEDSHEKVMLVTTLT